MVDRDGAWCDGAIRRGRCPRVQPGPRRRQVNSVNRRCGGTHTDHVDYAHTRGTDARRCRSDDHAHRPGASDHRTDQHVAPRTSLVGRVMSVLEGASADADPVGEFHGSVWGTSLTLLVTDRTTLSDAVRLLMMELDAFDRAANRFRSDSELSRLNEETSASRRVSSVLFAAVDAALRVAAATAGVVDPTICTALERLGYDRDFDSIGVVSPRPPVAPSPGGWQSLHLDRRTRSIARPPGVRIDLGASAKALCADQAAGRIYSQTGAGALVGLGGDIGTAGPCPEGGWIVVVRDEARSTSLEGPCRVALSCGGLASSGTATRTWVQGGSQVHHIIDPTTGRPAAALWRLATVAAASCLDANAAATAAIVWADAAPYHLAQFGLPARLVRADGVVIEIGGWPSPAECDV
jgi:FAD:protein FMN transferase